MNELTRREFLRLTGAATIGALAFGGVGVRAHRVGRTGPRQITRDAVVRRHNPRFSKFDPFQVLSLGNGRFAFNVDVTGLQTFWDECAKEFPICTVSHWGWHTTPMLPELWNKPFVFKEYDVQGRKVGYATDDTGQEALFNWLRQNPHRFNLGRLGLELKLADGRRATPADLRGCDQVLDLWRSVLTSRFEFLDRPVYVRTVCDPNRDCVGVLIESPLLGTEHLAMELAFPYGSPQTQMSDWTKPELHTTRCVQRGHARFEFVRDMDDVRYRVLIQWRGRAKLEQTGPHQFTIQPQSSSRFELVCWFIDSETDVSEAAPTFAAIERASAQHWERYWSEGGFIDLEGSTDNRAEELERRMILSLYQTAIHCAGPLPSQETGLLFNSWYGKFHLEMHWWHSVHFAVWNRFELFERSLDIYERILPLARETARRQGYRGARWPKMIGPDGVDSPSKVGPLLIWQQPHPVYYAELCYRHRPGPETLNRWRQIVFETAEFMASFVLWDDRRNMYVIGPPLKTVSENNDTTNTWNPTFELTYWRFGLRLAQLWRQRLGLKPHPHWQKVLDNLAPAPVADGLYLFQDGLTDTYTRWNWEHPALVGALGMLPGDGIDLAIMRASVRRVLEVWDWERAWGWDFPLTAMAAARCGLPELAVDALLIPARKNLYLPNGHNYQRPGLTAYLPGNGGLLSALAMMAAGWTGAEATDAPGFPKNGKWRVRWEDLATWV